MTDAHFEESGSIPQETALIIVDVQKGFEEPGWGQRNNPQAEENIARLLDAWRRTGRPIYFIQHQSRNPQSALRPNYVGSEIKDEVQPLPGEPVLQKNVNSAFIGTDLEDRLRANNQETVVVTGLTTDHCVSTTARMASNLGFRTIVVEDATATFDRPSHDGKKHYTAEEIHTSELSSLHGEFADILDTDTLLHLAGVGARTEAEAAPTA